MASNQQVNLQSKPIVRQINYTAKTFADFRQNLIEFTKSYYPNTYSDFNETSPGMMFIEMASYIGDVLSFYIDNQFKENLLDYAEQPENIITLAQFLGYKPKLTSPATATAKLYQVTPAVLENGVYVPNRKYLAKVGRGSRFTTNGQVPIQFRLLEDVDFTNYTEDEYVINSFTGGNPSTFLITKDIKLIAVEEKTVTFTFGSAQKFTSVVMPDEPIVSIQNVVDSDGNTWYEVDYLAQDVIMDDLDISSTLLSQPGSPSKKLRLRRVPRRFVTRISRNFRTELLFGSGVSNDISLNLTLDSRQVATNQYGNSIKNILGNTSLNNVNFLDNTAYGLAPANTTLTVTYWTGGGILTNTPSNTIVNISNLVLLNDTTNYTTSEINTFNAYVQGMAVNNELPATGGGGSEPLEEIKQNALGFFNAQNRVVTVDDYITRTYALPERYGKIAKAYAIRDEQINRIVAQNDKTYVNNPVKPNTINLYTLGFDNAKKLTTLNSITKDNLARYLEQYRLLTDDVNILDAFIINIGVRFDISVFRNYNVNDVMARCMGTIQNYFNIDNWSVNQPIILSDITYLLGSVDGVQTVKNLTIFNKYQYNDGEGYQNYRYDINEATINGVIYPSLDPSIFELKYPQTDIIGNVTQ